MFKREIVSEPLKDKEKLLIKISELPENIKQNIFEYAENNGKIIPTDGYLTLGQTIGYFLYLDGIYGFDTYISEIIEKTRIGKISIASEGEKMSTTQPALKSIKDFLENPMKDFNSFRRRKNEYNTTGTKIN